MPHFSLPSATGVVDTRTLLGKGPMVLYFYPKDETQGCTIEACTFRDEHEAFAAAKVTIVGVSPDSIDSHRAFAERHALPFLLLSDPDRRVFDLYGVESFLGMMPGRETFVMDADGVVRHHIRSALRPKRHVREALAVARHLA